MSLSHEEVVLELLEAAVDYAQRHDLGVDDVRRIFNETWPERSEVHSEDLEGYDEWHDYTEEELDEYDPGPEVDDEGGMSERRWDPADPRWPPTSDRDT